MAEKKRDNEETMKSQLLRVKNKLGQVIEANSLVYSSHRLQSILADVENEIDSIMFANDANNLVINQDFPQFKSEMIQTVQDICDLLSQTFETILSKDPNLKRRSKHCWKNESNNTNTSRFGDIEQPIPSLHNGLRKTVWDYYSIVKQVIYHELDDKATASDVVTQEMIGKIISKHSNDIFIITREIIKFVIKLVFEQYYHDYNEIETFIKLIEKEDKYLILSLLVGSKCVKYLKYVESIKDSTKLEGVNSAIVDYLLSIVKEKEGISWKLRLSSTMAFYLTFNPNIGIKFNHSLASEPSSVMTAGVDTASDNSENMVLTDLFYMLLQCGITIDTCPDIDCALRSWNIRNDHSDFDHYYLSLKGWQPELFKFLEMGKYDQFKYDIFNKIYVIRNGFHHLRYSMYHGYAKIVRYLVEYLDFTRDASIMIPRHMYNSTDNKNNINNDPSVTFMDFGQATGVIAQYFKEYELAIANDTSYYVATQAREMANKKLYDDMKINYWALTNGWAHGFGKFIDKPNEKEYILPLPQIMLKQENSQSNRGLSVGKVKKSFAIDETLKGLKKLMEVGVPFDSYDALKVYNICLHEDTSDSRGKAAQLLVSVVRGLENALSTDKNANGELGQEFIDCFVDSSFKFSNINPIRKELLNYQEKNDTKSSTTSAASTIATIMGKFIPSIFKTGKQSSDTNVEKKIHASMESSDLKEEKFEEKEEYVSLYSFALSYFKEHKTEINEKMYDEMAKIEKEEPGMFAKLSQLNRNLPNNTRLRIEQLPWWNSNKQNEYFKSYGIDDENDTIGTSNYDEKSDEFGKNKAGIRHPPMGRQVTQELIDSLGGKSYINGEFRDAANERLLQKSKIVAHDVNPHFQKECKAAFEGLEGNGKYKDAPVKKIERARVKAAIDYANEKQPSSATVNDWVRCSVVFKTVGDLMIAVSSFIAYVDGGHSKIITDIKKIENGFSKFYDWDGDATKGDYCDLKLSCIVCNPLSGAQMFGEIQFQLAPLYALKGLSHKLYSLTRYEAMIQQTVHLLCMEATSSSYRKHVFALEDAGNKKEIRTRIVGDPVKFYSLKDDDGRPALFKSNNLFDVKFGALLFMSNHFLIAKTGTSFAIEYLLTNAFQTDCMFGQNTRLEAETHIVEKIMQSGLIKDHHELPGLGLNVVSNSRKFVNMILKHWGKNVTVQRELLNQNKIDSNEFMEQRIKDILTDAIASNGNATTQT